jgi:copper resistance protein D
VRALYLTSVFLHVLAAITWIGGMVFLVVVFVPLTRRPATRDKALALFHELGPRLRTLGWIALGTLVVNGAYNVSVRGFGLLDWLTGKVFAGEWGETLLHKLLVVVVILVMSVVHDFVSGPRGVHLPAGSKERERYRKLASFMGRATFFLALVVLALAVKLVR